MSRQNHYVAGDMGREQPVEAEKPNDVRGSGSQAQYEREGPAGHVRCRGRRDRRSSLVDDIASTLSIDLAARVEHAAPARA